MAIKVCDAIMGSGKSSAAIQFMNEHPQEKYIYITPYLEEAERIRINCPALQFVAPSNKLKEYDFKKFKHTVELIREGRNICSTHNLFLRYTDDLTELIRQHEYTLIVDEAVEVLRPSSITTYDMRLLEKAGWITRDNGYIRVDPSFEYRKGAVFDIVSLSKGNRLIDMSDINQDDILYYWVFSKDILEAFKDIYILTYLFDAQTMKYYLDMQKMTFSYIGISRDSKGGYHFSDIVDYIPAYTATLSDKIHILENDKLNAIGDDHYALSYSWYNKNSDSAEEIKKLKNNVYNFFNNYNRDLPATDRLWAAYKSAEGFIRGKGYYYNSIAFNAKATNDYRDRHILAYCVNVFLKPIEKHYLTKHGVDVLEDKYALSVMLQWIWRSAIREGEEIWIYIPSSRMRNLLKTWIYETEGDYREHYSITEETNEDL